MRQIIAEDEEERRESTGEVTLSQPVSRSERVMSRRDIVEGSEFVHQQSLPRVLIWRYALGTIGTHRWGVKLMPTCRRGLMHENSL